VQLPERVETERLVLRHWIVDDVPELGAAIARSIEHLRPWMPWVEFEPLSDDERRTLVERWETERAADGDAVYGMFARDGRVVGGTGLHRRNSDRSVLDVGYWVAADATGQRFAREASAALIDAAFSLPDVSAVDIHHDRANVRSRRVPDELGFRFLGETADSVDAPGEDGVDCHWRHARPRRDGITIRTPDEAERPAVRELVGAAFTNSGHDGREEVDIVDRTWSLPELAVPDGLELVALDGDEIVGHVLAAIGHVGSAPVPGIAPLAVMPGHQGAGIGSALMRELIANATAAGWPMLALLGSTTYYSRFGFESSGPWHITYRPVGSGNPHFQVLPLRRLDERPEGDFVYCWERDT
jgi:predicted N-acetyltransferase YhbS